jgi:hypothetical protein
MLTNAEECQRRLTPTVHPAGVSLADGIGAHEAHHQVSRAGKSLPLAITETGVDVVPPVGWKNYFTEEHYLGRDRSLPFSRRAREGRGSGRP